jgi:hypothetical protein
MSEPGMLILVIFAPAEAGKPDTRKHSAAARTDAPLRKRVSDDRSRTPLQGIDILGVPFMRGAPGYRDGYA